MVWSAYIEDLSLVRFIIFMQKTLQDRDRGRILRRISCRKPLNSWSVLWAYAPQRFRTYYTYAQKVENQAKPMENGSDDRGLYHISTKDA